MLSNLAEFEMLKRTADITPKASFKSLDGMARGYQITQVLNTAVNFDVFAQFKKAKTAKEISGEMKTDFELTKKFLDVLVSLKLLSKKKDRYVNTKFAATFLLKDSPFYQGNLINLVAEDYDIWSKLSKMLKGEKIPEKRVANTERYILAMAEANMNGSLQKTVKTVSNLSDFKKAKKLLDLGGGHGLHSIAFVQENPDLKATVFDFPWVVEVAKQFISRYGMQDRVGVMAGDYMKDDIEKGYDVIFTSHTFYKPKNVLKIPLKKIYNALNEGGVAVFSQWMRYNKVQADPATMTLWELRLSLRGYKPYIYTKDEFTRLLREMRFSVKDFIDISTSENPSMLLVAEKEVK